jgi:hypothetical protein
LGKVSGAPPSTHAGTSAISNGDSDGSFREIAEAARPQPTLGIRRVRTSFLDRRRPGACFLIARQGNRSGGAVRAMAAGASRAEDRRDLAIPRNLRGDAIVGLARTGAENEKGPGHECAGALQRDRPPEAEATSLAAPLPRPGKLQLVVLSGFTPSIEYVVSRKHHLFPRP